MVVKKFIDFPNVIISIVQWNVYTVMNNEGTKKGTALLDVPVHLSGP